MRKGQATMEFVIAFGAIMFLFMAAMAVLMEYFWDQDKADSQEFDLWLDSFGKTLDLALLSEGTIQMPFLFPETFDGKEYAVTFTQDQQLGMTLIELHYPEHDRVRVSQYVPKIINSSDLASRGIYTIKKNASGLYLSP